jgi:hypothetical protein
MQLLRERLVKIRSLAIRVTPFRTAAPERPDEGLCPTIV